MSAAFLKELVSPVSYKKDITEESKLKFSNQPDVYLIHSPIMYRLYILFTGEVEHLNRSEFFRKAGFYLYYEKFPCRHGIEFYYWIKFNEDSAFYQEHKDLIKQLILSNDPSTLYDYIGYRNLNGYNKQLKEKLQ